MALGYPGISQPNASTGAGTALIGTYWEKSLMTSLQTQSNFLRFTDPAISDVPLLMAGKGQQVNFSVVDPLAVDGSALVAGTRTPTGSQASSDRTAVVAEYGEGLNLEGFQAYLTNPAYQPTNAASYYQAMNAIQALTDWSVATADYLVGASLLTTATTNYININGSNAVTFGTAEAGTYDFTAANVMEMAAGLAARGIAGRAELGGRWAIVGPAGAFNQIRQIDGIQRDAASLGIGDLYNGGFQFAWQGFAFFDQIGATANALNARPAAGTAGLCILLGGAAVAHDNTIGGAFNVNSPGWMVYYPDYGQDNGRVQRIQANFKAITAKTVVAADKHRTWLVKSFQNA